MIARENYTQENKTFCDSQTHVANLASFPKIRENVLLHTIVTEVVASRIVVLVKGSGI